MKTKKLLIYITVGLVTLCGCGGKTKDSGLSDKLESIKESAQEQEDPESEGSEKKEPEIEEETDEKESVGSGELPRYFISKHSDYNYDGDILRGDHRYGFLKLSKDFGSSHPELLKQTEKLNDDIRDAEKSCLKNEEDIIAEWYADGNEVDISPYHDEWNIYVARSDETYFSVIVEAKQESSVGDFYDVSFTAHTWYTETGKEISLSDVFPNEDGFYDALTESMYGQLDNYLEDNTWKGEKLNKKLRELMKEGKVSWVMNPQGIYVWVDSYIFMPQTLGVFFDLRDKNDAWLFGDEFKDNVPDEWVTMPMKGHDQCVVLNDDEMSNIIVSDRTELEEYEGNETFYYSGIYIGVDGDWKEISTKTAGGTDPYDVFLMHKDNSNVLFTCHYEYAYPYINTWLLNREGVKEVEDIKGHPVFVPEDERDKEETFVPYYVPCDLSSIDICLESDKEGDTEVNVSLNPDGTLTTDDGKRIEGETATEGAYEDDGPFFGLWIGSYKERQTALDLTDKLREEGLEAYSIYSVEYENLNKEPYWCVTIGKSGSEPEAQSYIEDAKKAGYRDAYVKYTGERLSHRIYYYMYGTADIGITGSKVTLKDIPIEELSGTAESEGPMTLIIDSDTEFDKTCDMQFFPGYKKGESPLEWFNHAKDADCMGVFEVGITGNHIDKFYGSYWWD